MPMRKILLVSIAWVSMTSSAWAAQANDDVCLVTFSDAEHAQALDVRAVAMATVVPRFTGEKLASPVAKVFNYPDTQSAVTACQCLGNPAPANSMVEREKALLSCPKPGNTDTEGRT